MNRFAWVTSSIGKKVLMALTGGGLLGFVIAHLAGNLLIFAGPSALNAYALKLEHVGWGLWVARTGLFAALVVHILTSVRLSIENGRARSQPYARTETARTTLAARTMLMSGILLLAFVIYHLLHFTFRVTHPDISHGIDAMGRRDVYTMVVKSFQHLPISVAYLVGVGAVCMHISHGIGSMFQTLGLNNERTTALVSNAGRAAAALIFLGYSAIPLAALTGYLR
jgi:succinate dehydrogenase / fumarate reductase cytochrome b subunit